MDKVQENENIIQSFSRTNRLFNNIDKPFGTIKYYRYPFTMRNNIEEAVKNYSGGNPFGVFVSSLDVQLTGMNAEFDEIKSVFDGAGIPDFSRLPDDLVAKRKFSDRFKKFSSFLAAAKGSGKVCSSPKSPFWFDITAIIIGRLQTVDLYMLSPSSK